MNPSPLGPQTAVVEPGADVAPNVRLGPFVHVAAGASIGADTIIEGLTSVPAHVVLGRGVRVGSGACFIAADAPGQQVRVGDRATIGAKAILWPGIEIGQEVVLTPGVEVRRSVPPMAIVEGHPARISGYVGAPRAPAPRPVAMDDQQFPQGREATAVRGVTLHRMPCVIDMRGSLTVGEAGRSVPFEVKRYFMVFDVPSLETRGEHAHRECHQFLLCVKGSCAVVADDGVQREEFLLDSPRLGLHLPPMTWGIQYKYTPDAVLLVLASHHYDSADYIRDYSEFRQLATSRGGERAGDRA